MDDLGAPISYLVLETGAPVYASDGEELGQVDEIRADDASDIFDGLVVGEGVVSRTQRYVPGDQVDEIYERGVVLALDGEAAARLPEPE